MTKRLRQLALDDRVLLAAGVGIICAHLLVLMEWLFAVTRPSFLTSISTLKIFGLLLLAPMPLIVAFVLPATIARAMGVATQKPIPAQALRWAACGINGLLITITVMLVGDNFTYNTVGFGISTTQVAGRAFYLLVLVALMVGTTIWLARWESNLKPQESLRFKRLIPPLAGLPIIGTVAFGIGGEWHPREATPIPAESSLAVEDRPNVVVLLTDALNAADLAVYGNERMNTPFLVERAAEALVAENAFANAPDSTASEVSLLTGRTVLAAGVKQWPDILTGDDTRMHMPGILRQLDYSLFYVGLRYFADPFDVNLVGGFHTSGQRSDLAQRPMHLVRPVWGEATAFFLYSVGDRVVSRAEHLAGRRNLSQEFEGIEGRLAAESDRERMRMLAEFVAEAPEPFYAHAHLLGTHGPSYAPWIRRFASKEDPPQPLDSPGAHVFDDIIGLSENAELWEAHTQDLRDDMIHLFDDFVAEVMSILEQRGISDNTLVIVGTDHTAGHDVDQRIPLVLFFPDRSRSGSMEENVQLLDLAPTILELAGAEIPDWMEGLAIDPDDPPPMARPIFSVQVLKATQGKREREGGAMIRSVIAPPFYDYRTANAVVGQHLWRLDLGSGEISREEIEGHTAPLNGGELPTTEEMRALLTERAAHYGVGYLGED